MAKMKESRLQARIRKALEDRYPHSWLVKFHGGPFTPAGVPDLIGCISGFFIALEVKNPGENPSVIQSRVINRIQLAGGISGVITSFEEAVQLIDRGIGPQYWDSRLPSRFWEKTYLEQGPMETACWRWAGAKNPLGYGKFRIGSKKDNTRRLISPHRLTYSVLIKPIPEELEIDHLCRVVDCSNPQHLEPTTHQENIRRGINVGRPSSAL